MANQKISQLPTASALDGSELVEIVQGGSNKKTTAQVIADLGTGGGGGGDTDITGKLDSIATIVDGGTNYTLQGSDLTLINLGANVIIEGDGTGTLTIPANATVAFPISCFIGFRGFIAVAGVPGDVTATPTNATLDCDPGFTFALEKTATNTWIVNNGAEDTGGGGGGGDGVWGSITGTLTDQTDLNLALADKQDADTDLGIIAGLSPTNDDILQRKSGNWANRTIAQLTADLPNAAADGTTKGVAAFTAADFNATSGVISIDYTNGQAASGSNKGFLTAADWTTFNNKTNNTFTVSTKTASYTLVSGDATAATAGAKLKYLMNAATPIDFNIATNANAAFAIGTEIVIFQYGTSQTTIVPLTGVTMRSPLNANKTYGQYSEARITKVATDEWILSGDITP